MREDARYPLPPLHPGPGRKSHGFWPAVVHATPLDLISDLFFRALACNGIEPVGRRPLDSTSSEKAGDMSRLPAGRAFAAAQESRVHLRAAGGERERGL